VRTNRLGVLQKEIANLTDAIASGALRASPAIADRLTQAEAELARLRVAKAQEPPANPERLLTDVADRYRKLVDGLDKSLTETDVGRARAELRALFGSINVVADEWEVRLEAGLRQTQAPLLQVVGATTTANNVVAGV
jgi:HAMP domain-containing protein